MCNYILQIHLCTHHRLFAGSYCHRLYTQLTRANDPAQLRLFELPFELLDSCDPNRWNVRRVYVQECCSWECWERWNGDVGSWRGRGEHERKKEERIGVGWRYGEREGLNY